MLAEWTQRLYSIGLDASLRSLLLACMVGALLAALRIRSSALRHTAWRVVLVGMLLMPVLPYRIPAVAIPVPFPVIAPQSVATAKEATPFRVLNTAQNAYAESSPGKSIAQASMPVSTTPWMWIVAVIVYGLGALILLSRLLWGWMVMRRIAIGSVAPDHYSDAPVIWQSAQVLAPVTIGVLMAKIVLPSNWVMWPKQKVNAVIAHELAHVQRRDPLVGFLARFNCCIFWFHPLAWWLEKKLATTAEHVCDDAAIHVTEAPHEYVELLLDIASTVRRRGGRLSLHGIGVEGNGPLGRRIDRILRGDFALAISRTRKALVVLGCGGAFVLTAAGHERVRLNELLRSETNQAPGVFTATATIAEGFRWESREHARLAQPSSRYSEQAPIVEPPASTQGIAPTGVESNPLVPSSAQTISNNSISPDKEDEFRKKLAAQLGLQLTLIEDSAVNEYIDRVGQNLVRNSDSQLPVTFKIVKFDRINAFTVPSGIVYVSSAAVLAAENEAELAAVMATQIGHLAARHRSETAANSQTLNLATIPLIFVGGPGGPSPAANSKNALFSSFSRKDIDEADFLGLQYLYKAGYDPNAALTFFRKLQIAEAAPGSPPAANGPLSNVARSYAANPPATSDTADRIEKTRQAIAILPARDRNVVTTPQFDQMKVRLAQISRD